jgi:hypothetical protein
MAFTYNSYFQPLDDGSVRPMDNSYFQPMDDGSVGPMDNSYFQPKDDGSMVPMANSYFQPMDDGSVGPMDNECKLLWEWGIGTNCMKVKFKAARGAAYIGLRLRLGLLFFLSNFSLF